ILLGAQILIKDAQYERAVEWLGTYEQTPFHRVTHIWGWYEQYRARIIAIMGQASFDSAYKRGALRGFNETIEDVMGYIEKLESAT
ncbi:MAG TPA: hypothetical protein PLZ51_28295, partial [Aggregatilineales bacterium]|nr:hypothetical protein [Aggregatilineales bacterium]